MAPKLPDGDALFMSAESFRDAYNRIVQQWSVDDFAGRLMKCIEVEPNTVYMVGRLTAEEEFMLGTGQLSPETAAEIVASRSAILRNVT